MFCHAEKWGKCEGGGFGIGGCGCGYKAEAEADKNCGRAV